MDTAVTPTDTWGPIMDTQSLKLYLDQAELSWSQACIEMEQVGDIEVTDAPLDAAGNNIFLKSFFDLSRHKDATYLVEQHERYLTPDVVTIFIGGPFSSTDVRAFALAPYPNSAQIQRLVSDKYSLTVLAPHIGPRDLAHEFGHILALTGHKGNEPYYFFPVTLADIDRSFHDYVDYHVNTLRRLPPDVVDQARRNPFLLNHTGE